MNRGRVIPTAEPFFFPGGRTGCLVIHGFTGAPREVRLLGEHMAKQGHTVLGVRLSGHATDPKDLLRARWQDWVTDVEDGWNMLSGCTDRIIPMGLSMGGALSLMLAARFTVAGVVAMSAPYQLPSDWRLPYAEIFSRVQPSVPKGLPDWQNPQLAVGHVDYPSYPTRAIAELRDLLEEMRRRLPQVTAPTLLIYSKNDGSVRVDDRHAELIMEGLGSARKSVEWVENSGHVITEDAERDRVFALAARFVESL